MHDEPDRAEIREELFERVRNAATAFYVASAAHTRAVAEFGGTMLDNSDGTFALLQTARLERQAIEGYYRAVKGLADFLQR